MTRHSVRGGRGPQDKEVNSPRPFSVHVRDRETYGTTPPPVSRRRGWFTGHLGVDGGCSQLDPTPRPVYPDPLQGSERPSSVIPGTGTSGQGRFTGLDVRDVSGIRKDPGSSHPAPTEPPSVGLRPRFGTRRYTQEGQQLREEPFSFSTETP